MKKFTTIVAETFSIDETDVRDEMSSKDIKEWDSMNYLLFIAELEKEYNVSFSMDEVMGATCLGDIRIALEKKQ
jgi:acyl carrier protein